MQTSAALAEAARAAIRNADKARQEADAAQRNLVNTMPIPGTYNRFLPKAGDHLVVQLGGETVRVPIKKIVDEDTVIFHLDSVPTSRSHHFVFEKSYGARRRVRDGRDVWEAQEDRDFLAEQQRLMAVREKAPKVPAKKGRK